MDQFVGERLAALFILSILSAGIARLGCKKRDIRPTGSWGTVTTLALEGVPAVRSHRVLPTAPLSLSGFIGRRAPHSSSWLKCSFREEK